MEYPVLPNYLVACSNTLFLYDCQEENILLVPYVLKAFSQIVVSQNCHVISLAICLAPCFYFPMNKLIQ